MKLIKHLNFQNLCKFYSHQLQTTVIALTQKSCIFTQSASQKMYFWICSAPLGRKYKNLLS